MDLDRVQKPLRQLRKSLKRLPDDPPPEAVHKLRTRARHIEAIAAALTSPDEKKTRRLLKSIKPVRKAAGNVRDMDVLTSNALTLPQNDGQESLVRLIEHLGVARQKSASDLLDTVDQQRKSARRLLKQYAKRVESTLDHKNARQPSGSSAQAAQHVQAVVANRIDELRRWPAFSARNIHPFRLKVKELRSILQLLPDADSNLVSALGSVKDQIGDWHDWQQLAQTAAEMLDSSEDRALLTQINKIGKQKLSHALASANALRKRYFRLSSRHRASG
ncbi:MAG TPA: CHAD domain-containing protein [Terracidiphilus sp.]|jgi:CHAD domain-containing protein|nr:CHAD domain-containing protein [Terracidiphilus sp.]